jgi:hypothetical protein
MNFPKHLLLAALALGFVAAAGAWQGPTQPAPQGNVPAPVNVGGLAQSKAGTLGVGGLGVFGRGFVSGASGFNLADSLTFGVDGKVGARAYCDINGQNCVATPGGAAGTTTATTTTTLFGDPDYESGWITARAKQDGVIVHNLGTKDFSMMQTIIRQNGGANNDEATFYGHDACAVAFGQTVAGVYYLTDVSDDPENKIKYWVGYTGPCYHPSMIDTSVRNTAWGKRYGNWTTHIPNPAEFKVRLWR